MAKPYKFSATLVVVTALCLLSLVEIAQSKASKAQTKGAAASPAESKSAPSPGGAEEEFYVQGQVYCDTCRAQFITKASSFLQGASVGLECREREGGKMTLSVEGETDHTGTYNLPVSGDHEQEICEINLIKSPNPDCSEISKDGYSKAVARISLTSNSGLATNVRLANPIGFMMKEPLAECREILDELGVLPDQH